MPFFINVFFVEEEAEADDKTASKLTAETEAKPVSKPSLETEGKTDLDEGKLASPAEEVENLNKLAPSGVNPGKHEVSQEIEDAWRKLIQFHFESRGVEVSLEVEHVEGVSVLSFLVEIGEVDPEKLAAEDPQVMNRLFKVASRVVGKKQEHVVEGQAKKRLENHAILKLPPLLQKDWHREHPEGQDVVVICKAVADQGTWLALVMQAAEFGTCPWRHAPARLLKEAWSEIEDREQAEKQGLLRPWLLIASMPMQIRTDMANDLGVALSACSPGKEANEILLQAKVGICPRIDGVKQKFVGGVMRAFKGEDNPFHSSWTHILLRLLAKSESSEVDIPRELARMDSPPRFVSTRREGNKASIDKDGVMTPIGELEKIALNAVQSMWLETLSDEEKAEVEEIAENCDAHALSTAGLAGLERLVCLARSQESEEKVPLSSKMMDKLKTVGVRMALTRVAGMMCPGLGHVMLARNITMALFGSNPLGCEKAVMLILLHRLALAADGLNIDALMPGVGEDEEPQPIAAEHASS